MKTFARTLAILLAVAFAAIPASAQFTDQKTWKTPCGGSSSAYTLAIPNWTANLPGVPLRCIAAATNIANPTFSVNAITPVAIKKTSRSGLASLVGGEIVTGNLLELIFDRTEFVLLNPGPPLQPTHTELTSGTGATYTTPIGATRLYIRMVAGGGSGAGGSATNGSAGTATSFGSTNVQPGGGGLLAGTPGAGGVGGTGSAIIRIGGGAAALGQGSSGGSTTLGPGAAGNCAPPTSSGFGAGGSGQLTQGPGGGGGEYAEVQINNPSATYTYTVGIGGNTGCAVPSASAGRIIIDEYYN